MPIAFFIVAAVTFVTVWMNAGNSSAANARHLNAEAQYVATNMINYQNQILAYANLTDGSGNLLNQSRFTSATGDAAKFISACAAAGQVPKVLAWFPGPAPGVSAQIVNQVVIVQYNPPDGRSPSQAGVQAQLLLMAGGTSLTGRVM
jgi:hypothetical protein